MFRRIVHDVITRHVSRLVLALLLMVSARAAGKEASWLKLTTSEFTLITSLKEKEARAWAGDFSQFIATMRSFFADGDRKLPPLTVVIFARERDYLDYRPLGTNGKPQPVMGFFSRRGSWAVVGLSDRYDSAELRRTIFHEGTHWFMSAPGRRLPIWLEEGLAEVFSTFAVVKGKARFGEPIDEHVEALRELGRMPLPQLFAARKDQLFSGSATQTGLMYAQSWALVHYLMFGEHTFSRQALSDYFKLVGRSRPTEAMFERAFGRSVPALEREFGRYLEDGDYFVWQQPLVSVVPPQVAAASAAELSNALGRLALVGGRMELAESHARAAIAAEPDSVEGKKLLSSVLNSKNFAGRGRGPRRGGS